MEKLYRKLACKVILVVALLSQLIAIIADEGRIIQRFSGCDYFIADGNKGLYVLEWYGGYDPKEGDRISGDIGRYGMKTVTYPNVNRTGRVWVEDYLESRSAAMDEINDHCR